jgi:hypothetical protein
MHVIVMPFSLKASLRSSIVPIDMAALLYHRLVRQLHRPQPQGSPEVGTVSPTHHREHTASPLGHLQHPVSPEGQEDHQGPQSPGSRAVYPTIIQNVRSVQVHQSWDRETGKTASFPRSLDCYIAITSQSPALNLVTSWLPPGYSTLYLRGCCPMHMEHCVITEDWSL